MPKEIQELTPIEAQARISYEQHLAKLLNMPYEGFKRITDDYESMTGRRYGKLSDNQLGWEIWLSSWNACLSNQNKEGIS